MTWPMALLVLVLVAIIAYLGWKLMEAEKRAERASAALTQAFAEGALYKEQRDSAESSLVESRESRQRLAATHEEYVRAHPARKPALPTAPLDWEQAQSTALNEFTEAANGV